jgi:hypothetical protein
MVLTRAQAAKLKAALIPLQNSPDVFAKQVKAEAEAKRVQDAATAAELDALADMFSTSVNVGKSPEEALAEAFGRLGVGGRRKTRKGKKSKRKTRRH